LQVIEAAAEAGLEVEDVGGGGERAGEGAVGAEEVAAAAGVEVAAGAAAPGGERAVDDAGDAEGRVGAVLVGGGGGP
jgi:hypothetical protein